MVSHPDLNSQAVIKANNEMLINLKQKYLTYLFAMANCSLPQCIKSVKCSHGYLTLLDFSQDLQSDISLVFYLGDWKKDFKL